MFWYGLILLSLIVAVVLHLLSKRGITRDDAIQKGKVVAKDIGDNFAVSRIDDKIYYEKSYGIQDSYLDSVARKNGWSNTKADIRFASRFAFWVTAFIAALTLIVAVGVQADGISKTNDLRGIQVRYESMVERRNELVHTLEVQLADYPKYANTVLTALDADKLILAWPTLGEGVYREKTGQIVALNKELLDEKLAYVDKQIAICSIGNNPFIPTTGLYPDCKVPTWSDQNTSLTITDKGK